LDTEGGAVTRNLGIDVRDLRIAVVGSGDHYLVTFVHHFDSLQARGDLIAFACRQLGSEDYTADKCGKHECLDMIHVVFLLVWLLLVV
jgi:hypothetical protein